ncbi:MAG TPA: hypothetical protein VH044_10995 [Polyangiaceae bacterium]|nr:hypothetical protein [Polyangiaceae bacterium]
MGFVAMEGAAMCLYPGGTWWNATTRGHRFWQNYLCDLEWRVALDGQPNALGSTLAQAAMVLLVAGLAPFWLALPRLFAPHSSATPAPDERPAWSGRTPLVSRAVPALGLTSVVATTAAIFMPSDRFGALHGATVIVACVPGLAAAALAVLGLARGEPRPRVAAALGGAMLAFAFVDFVLYASHFLAHTEGSTLVPALEKVALILLLSWMVTVATRAGRAQAAAQRKT